MMDEKMTKQELVGELKKLQGEINRLKKSNKRAKFSKSPPLEYEESYKALYNSSVWCLYIHDFKGQFLDANQAALDLAGYHENEIATLKISSLLDEFQLSRANQNIEEIIKYGFQKTPAEYKIRKKNGEFVWVDVAGYLIYRSGKPYAIQGIARDITDKKKIALEHLRSHDLLMRIVETSPAGIVMMNRERKITFANSKAEKILGISKYRVTSQINGNFKWRVADFHANSFLDEALFFEQVMKTGKSVYNVMHEIKSTDGNYTLLSVNATPIFDEVGKVDGVVATIEDITKQKQIEENLKENRKHLEMALESSKADAWEMNLITGDFSYTERWTRMLGYDSHEIEKKIDAISKLIHKEDSLNHYKNLKAYIDGQTTIYETEYRVRKKNGEWLWVFSRGEAIEWDRMGKPVRLLGTTFDITEIKKVEEELKLERDKAQQYLDVAGVMLLLIDKDQKVVLINKKGCELLGYPEEEIIGKNWFDHFIPKADLSEVKTNFNEIISGNIESTEYFENSIVSKNGDERIIAWHNTIIKDKSGNIFGTLSSGEDITEQKKAEKALEQSEMQYRITLDAMADAIHVVDTKLRFVLMNSVLIDWCQESGWDADVIGYPMFDVLSFIPKKVKSEYKLVIQSGKIMITEESFFIGEKKYITEMKKIPIMENDKVTHVLTVLRDITDQKRSEEQIKKSLKEKEVLLKEIHHRVKNNLQVIISLLNLQADKLKDEASVEAFKEANHRIYSMALVHEQLYQSEDFATIHIKEFIETMVEKLYHTYSVMNRIDLDLKIANIGLGLTTAIPCGLILNELVSNALKHGFPGQKKGTIRISFRLLKNQTCKLTVEDDGIGVPNTLDIKDTKSLGMQLVNILTEQIDGKIILDRKQGTRFTLTFKAKE